MKQHSNRSPFSSKTKVRVFILPFVDQWAGLTFTFYFIIFFILDFKPGQDAKFIILKQIICLLDRRGYIYEFQHFTFGLLEVKT